MDASDGNAMLPIARSRWLNGLGNNASAGGVLSPILEAAAAPARRGVMGLNKWRPRGICIPVPVSLVRASSVDSVKG